MHRRYAQQLLQRLQHVTPQRGAQMSNRQLLLFIVAVSVVSLALAWTIERTQVRTFLGEFDRWWDEKNGSATPE